MFDFNDYVHVNMLNKNRYASILESFTFFFLLNHSV